MLIMRSEMGDLGSGTKYADFSLSESKLISVLFDGETSRVRQIILIDYKKGVGNGFAQEFQAKKSERITMDDITISHDGMTIDGCLDTDALMFYEDKFESRF